MSQNLKNVNKTFQNQMRMIMNQIMTKYIRKNSKQSKIGSFTYRRGEKK